MHTNKRISMCVYTYAVQSDRLCSHELAVLQLLSRHRSPDWPEWLRFDGFNDITPLRSLTRKHCDLCSCHDRAIFAASTATVDIMPPGRVLRCFPAKRGAHREQSRGRPPNSYSIRKRNEESRRWPYQSELQSSSFATLSLAECCSRIVADSCGPCFIVEPVLLNLPLRTLLAHVHIAREVLVG